MAEIPPIKLYGGWVGRRGGGVREWGGGLELRRERAGDHQDKDIHAQAG